MAERSNIKLTVALCNILCNVLAFVAELNGLVNVCVVSSLHSSFMH